MDTIAFLPEQLTQAREFLDGTMAGVSDEALHAPVPGALNPIAATYAHLVAGEDGFVNGLIRGGAPLFAGAWAGKTGLSEPPPDELDWTAWGRRVRVDLKAMRPYTAAVAAETDAYLASLTTDDLDRMLDLSSSGFGRRSAGWVIGEICALNGLQGGKGFPV